MMNNHAPRRGPRAAARSSRRNRRHLSISAPESLEAKLPLDASGFVGNDCAPDLDLSAVAFQSIRANQELTLDLYAIGATVTDVDASGNPTGDVIRLQLDPDDGPINATLTPEGIFSWTPTMDQIGTFDFVVIAVDGGDPPLADAEVLRVEVRANEAPDLAAVADTTAMVNEEVEIQLTAVDPTGDVLTFQLDPDQAATIGATLEQLDGNSAVLRWVPTASDAGQTQSFSVLVVDDGSPPLSDNEMFSVAVMTVAATDDSYRTVGDAAFSVDAVEGVLANDVDSDGDPLTVTVVQQPQHGSLALAADGSFTYTPDAGYRGVDVFTYRAQDANGDASIADVTINVNSVPAAAADDYSIAEGTTLTIDAAEGVLANDTDADGDSLTASILAGPEFGELTLNQDGSLVYAPESAATGLVTFTYLASDGLAVTEATVTITIDDVEAAPVAGDDAFSVAEDTELTILSDGGVLANDLDADGDTLTTILEDGPAHGTLDLAADGGFVYTPDPNFNGTDSFRYAATDGALVSNTAVVTIEVTPVNSAPLANPDSFTAGAASELIVLPATGLLANDLDEDGDQLTVQLVTNTNNGQLSLNPDGSFTYTSDAGFSGTDSFTYEVTDGEATSAAATVEIFVDAENQPPVGVMDSYNATEDQVLMIDAASGLLANDSDPDGDPLSAILVGEPGQGTVTLNSDGSFSYSPVENSSGLDGFSYQVSDGSLTSNETLVIFMVTTSNDAPITEDDAYEVSADQELNVAVADGVLANDTDIEADDLTVSVVSDVANGTLDLQPDGSFVYTPDAGFAGTDTFTYRADDGTDASDIATVSIVVLENNAFSISAGATSGTTVGAVSASQQLSSPVVYEFADASANAELMLNADDHLSGDPAAPVVLIEYLDFQCPACAAYHPIVSMLEDDFAGELLVVRRHLPLESVHQNARAAARAAEAAGRQGKFDEMGDLLFETQDAWEFATDPQPFFETYATVLELDLDQFRSDMADPALDARVTRDLTAAGVVGATGTPTFFLNRNSIENPTSLAAFTSLVQDELNAVDQAFAINRITGEIVVANDLADAPSSVTLPVTITDVQGNLEAVEVTVSVIEAAAGEPAATAIDEAISNYGDW